MMIDRGLTAGPGYRFGVVALFVLMMTGIVAAGPAAVAVAQGDQPAPGGVDELDGLRRAVFRFYQAPGDDEVDGLALAMIYLFEFESAEQARAATGAIEGQTILESVPEERAGLEHAEIDDLGDRAVLYTVAPGGGGFTLDLAFLLVRDGPYVSVVIGRANGGAADEPVPALTEFIVEAEAGADAETYREDGGSTGGLWEKIPDADDTDILGELAPVGDGQYPLDEATSGSNATPAVADSGAWQVAGERPIEIDGQALAVSPDGQWIAGLGPDRELCVWNIEGQEVTCDTERLAVKPETITWAPDSSAVAFALNAALYFIDSDIYVFDIEEGSC